MPLKDSAYKFQIILDRASIELFLNDGKYSMTNIFFPDEKYSNLKISSSESAELKNAAFYKIKRVWK
jgi:fructan beta-fructosidase